MENNNFEEINKTGNTVTSANQTVYFTFTLGKASYAIDVKSIKEVLTYEPITKVPRTIDYLKGVMNIRGSVIPVVDFRILFDIEPTAKKEDSHIVVTEISTKEEQPLTFGFIADTVEGVNDLRCEDIDNTNNANSAMSSKFIKKLGRLNEKFILILNMEKILEYIEEELEKTSIANS